MSCCDPHSPFGPVGTAYDAQGNPYVKHYDRGWADCPEMLFPDSRMRSPTALGLVDVAYPGAASEAQAAQLQDVLNALADALERADAMGLWADSRVVAARAIYEGARAGGSAAVVTSVRQQAQVISELVERTVSGLPTELGPLDRLKEWLVQPGLLGLPNWAAIAAGGAAVFVGTGTGLAVGARRRR